MNNFPRFISTTGGNNEIAAIEVREDTDSLYYCGVSDDPTFGVNSGTAIIRLIVAAMYISKPAYKWAK